MHENVPVRFGRGRLDSLVTKELAAYLILISNSSSYSSTGCFLDSTHVYTRCIIA
jgi:hypothetical protein